MQVQEQSDMQKQISAAKHQSEYLEQQLNEVSWVGHVRLDIDDL